MHEHMKIENMKERNMKMKILKMKSQGEGAGEPDGGTWTGWSQDLLSMFSPSL